MEDKQNLQEEPRENLGTKPGGKLMENSQKGGMRVKSMGNHGQIKGQKLEKCKLEGGSL